MSDAREAALFTLRLFASEHGLDDYAVEEWEEMDLECDPPRQLVKLVATAANGNQFAVSYVKT